ncbi:MAG: T9SS type A sorting domain-containing protein [Chlorobi bacterium]|nr:T9SS type A sorting domain-containing protein [Chlorobiota bacterium]MCI0715682.1 T9SS type A sorting domain-containing protein [Chlorobiota bacterium]
MNYLLLKISHAFNLSQTFGLALFIILNIQLFVFSQQPTQEWLVRWPPSSPANSGGNSIKLDNSGYIYVLADTGLSFGFLKYNQNGDLLFYASHWPAGSWTAGGGSFFDITPSGDVYILGNVNIDLDYWIYIVKFNTNGVFQWGKLYNYDTRDDPNGILIDNSGNVVVIGRASRGNAGFALTIKYNPNGDTLWTRYFNNGQPSAGNDRIVIDGTNSVYTVGFLDPLPGKTLIMKYSPTGNLIWFQTFTLDVVRSNLGRGITLDGNGNVYVIGTQIRPQSQTDTYILKLNSNGDTLWSRSYPNFGSGNNSLWGPIVSSNNNEIYYTESVRGGGLRYDIATLKYDSTGVLLWDKIYSGWPQSSEGLNLPLKIKLDRYNNIYVCGTGYYETTTNDFITLKYLPSGTLQWVARYTGLVTNGHDQAVDLFIDTNLNLIVTGFSRKTINTNFDAVTIKYSQPIGIISGNGQLPNEFKLEQNYPNPFNGTTIINYQLPRESEVNLDVFNAIGQNIKTVVNGKQQAGYYSIALNFQNLPSGVYFYQLIAVDNEIIETRKMILSK